MTITLDKDRRVAKTPRIIQLVPPSRSRLPGYVEALRRGWSPNTMYNVSGEQLALHDESPDRLLHELTRQDGMVKLMDGTRVPRLPSRLFWIFGREFCGAINLRFVPGTENLPPTCSGHIGYSIVPWKQRRGFATRALALVLPVAREIGLKRVLVTCDDDNVGSRKVMQANGGVFAGVQPPAKPEDKTKLLFWIDTAAS
jgi:predicted acetyltransferase